ncbi:MAG: hypothetical protein IJN29_06775 [Akkermansia sp.]|nr:hypothetical protein [Akkermansia sp.]
MSTEINKDKKATAKERLAVGAEMAVAKAKAATTWWGKALWLLAGAALALASMWLTSCTVSWSIGADGTQVYEHTIVVPAEWVK